MQQGINDYHAGVPIDNQQDPYSEYTFLGAIRSSVYAMRKVNPDVRIILVTPTYAWYVNSGQTGEEADYGGGILTDYVEAELEAARELNVEILDLYHDFYRHEKREHWELHTQDDIHPNQAGRETMAVRLAEAVSGNE